MRLCPKCLAKINNPDAFFCYNCGSRLPDKASEDIELSENKIDSIRSDYSDKNLLHNNVKNTPTVKKTIPINKIGGADTLSRRWNFFIVAVNALSIMFMVVALGVFFRSTTPVNNDLPLYPVVVVENVRVESTDGLKLADYVNKSKYYNVVPKGVSFYSEISDINTVTENLFLKEDISYLEKSLDMSFKDFLVFFKKDFAYAKKDGNYMLILKVGGFDFFDRAYAKYQENKSEVASVYLKRVGEFFVISNSLKLINTMESVSQGVEQSLASDIRFKSAITDIPINTVFFVYFNSYDHYAKFVEKDLPLLNLEKLQKYFVKFKPNLVSLTKQGNEYLLYPIE